VIRLLTHQDYDIVQRYLDHDPLHNIYLIHGLETHGLESDHVTFWGAFHDDRLEGVLFANNDDRSRLGFLAGDNPEVLARLGEFALKSEMKKLVGKSTYVQPAIQNLYSRVQIRVMSYGFCELYPGQLVPSYDYPVRAATEDDVPLLLELYRDYEFHSKNRPEEETEQEIRRVMDESGVYFFIEQEGQAVSAARVAVETDRAGVVDAATTLPEFRGRGMYPCVRTACNEYLFKGGKIGVSLIRDTNTNMRRIVSKYGGSFTDKWVIVSFRRMPLLRQRILPRRLRRWGLRMKDRVLGE